MQQQRRHGRRSHRRDWETGLLGFLTVFFGPDERWHKISARTIGYRLKVRTPAYSFDEVSHIAQSCRALATVRIVLSLLVHVSTLLVQTLGRPKLKAARLLRLFVCGTTTTVGRRKCDPIEIASGIHGIGTGECRSSSSRVRGNFCDEKIAYRGSYSWGTQPPVLRATIAAES